MARTAAIYDLAQLAAELARRGLMPALLDEYAAQTGDSRARAAAGMLRAKGRPGRRANDDASALGEIDHLLECGEAQTVEEAARMVAISQETPRWCTLDSTTRRLARKHRHLHPKKHGQNL